MFADRVRETVCVRERGKGERERMCEQGSLLWKEQHGSNILTVKY